MAVGTGGNAEETSFARIVAIVSAVAVVCSALITALFALQTQSMSNDLQRTLNQQNQDAQATLTTQNHNAQATVTRQNSEHQQGLQAQAEASQFRLQDTNNDYKARELHYKALVEIYQPVFSSLAASIDRGMRLATADHSSPDVDTKAEVEVVMAEVVSLVDGMALAFPPPASAEASILSSA